MQRLADCLGRPLELTDDPELSLRGAGVLALERAGGTLRALRRRRTVAPRSQYAERWTEAARRLVSLERTLFGGRASRHP